MISRENQLSICPNIRYGCSANSKIIQIKIDANFLFQTSKCQILNPFVLLFRRSACSYSRLLQSGISKRCSLPPVCKVGFVGVNKLIHVLLLPSASLSPFLWAKSAHSRITATMIKSPISDEPTFFPAGVKRKSIAIFFFFTSSGSGSSFGF